MSKRPWVASVVTAALLHASTSSAAVTLTYTSAPFGTADNIPGQISGLVNPETYTIGVLVSGDGGATWYDKTHDYPTGVPNPNNVGVPVGIDGSFL